jgi:hypothetical protein
MRPGDGGSGDDVDSDAVSWSRTKGSIARHEIGPNRFGEHDVHRVARGDVVTERPGATEEIDMGMAMEVQAGEVIERFGGTAGRHITHAYETPETLRDLDVNQMRDMQLIPVPKETRLDAHASFSLQQQFQHRRRIDDDHRDSRASRMMAAAGVRRTTRFRSWSLASISSRVGREAARSTSARR